MKQDRVVRELPVSMHRVLGESRYEEVSKALRMGYGFKPTMRDRGKVARDDVLSAGIFLPFWLVLPYLIGCMIFLVAGAQSYGLWAFTTLPIFWAASLGVANVRHLRPHRMNDVTEVAQLKHDAFWLAGQLTSSPVWKDSKRYSNIERFDVDKVVYETATLADEGFYDVINSDAFCALEDFHRDPWLVTPECGSQKPPKVNFEEVSPSLAQAHRNVEMLRGIVKNVKEIEAEWAKESGASLSLKDGEVANESSLVLEQGLASTATALEGVRDAMRKVPVK